MDEFTYPLNFSELARTMFIKLTKFVISMRYTALEALRHPWITRINKSVIPKTMED